MLRNIEVVQNITNRFNTIYKNINVACVIVTITTVLYMQDLWTTVLGQNKSSSVTSQSWDMMLCVYILGAFDTHESDISYPVYIPVVTMSLLMWPCKQ